jgi:hypothetical protein
MALLAVVLLTAMVIFVLNVGTQLNHRVACQNAADAAAMAVGTHMAKAMNTVAVDNMGIARMISAALVLDCQPEHIATSIVQADAFHQAMVAQLARGVGPGGTLQGATRTAIQNIRDELAQESLELHAASLAVAAINVPQYTQYVVDGASGPPPHGAFWRAARDLGRLSDATVSSAAAAAQKNAYDYGWASQAERAFAIPVLPAFPAIKGQWPDWHLDPAHGQSLLVSGWLPENPFAPMARPTLETPEPYTPDQVEALVRRSGPYAKLLRWRVTDLGAVTGAAAGPGPSVYDAGGWYPPWFSFPFAPHELTGYHVYGPYGWLRQQVFNFWYGKLKYAFPVQYSPNGRRQRIVQRLESVKLSYLFDPTLAGTGDTQLQPYHVPDFDTTFAHARPRAEDAGQACELTAHFRLVVYSPYRLDDPRIATAAFDPNFGNFADPNLVIEPGWHNRDKSSGISAMIRMNVQVLPIDAPRGVPSPIQLYVPVSLQKNWQRIETDMWEAQFRSQEFAAKLESMKGSVVWQMIRQKLMPIDPNFVARPFSFNMKYDPPPDVVMRDIFAGADFGHDAPIRNPGNFTSQDMADLPVPYRLDTSAGDYAINLTGPQQADHDAGVRRQQFSFLGVARRSTRPAAWAARFGTDAPDGQMTAIAQVQLYNTTSWDLWTQDWHAQLVPVTHLGDWVMRLKQRSSGDAAAGSLFEDDLDAAADYLQRVSNMDDPADTVIHH